MPKKPRVFSPELKLSIVKRLLTGEQAKDLARELKVSRTFLYRWKDIYRRLGEAGFHRHRGRKPGGAAVARGEVNDLAAAQKRVSELERKIGQQQMELDFFRRALRLFGGDGRALSAPGAKSPARSSKR